jgi:hypothetical protein
MLPLFKKSLFWDSNSSEIDLMKNKRYVIERILKFGDFGDYAWLKNTYAPQEIIAVIQRDRSELDKKSRNFWFHIYNIKNTYAPRNT